MGTAGLEVFDKAGVVVDTLKEETDEDELQSIYSPKTEKVEDEKAEAKPVEEKKVEEKPAEEAVAATSTEATETKPAEKTAEAKTEETEKVADQKEDRAYRLRDMEQQKEIAFLKARLAKLEKGMDNSTDEETEIKPSRIEELQSSINKVAETRGPVLETLLETMELSPKYADIREVCSQGNFSELVAMAADAVAKKENRDPVEVGLELEAAIWSEPNPYKTMYNLVKEHHPRYRVVKTETKKTEEKVEEKKEEKTKVAAKTAASIADAGTGAKVSMAGWTAARIDQMDESELTQVPGDVYEKYLQGALD